MGRAVNRERWHIVQYVIYKWGLQIHRKNLLLCEKWLFFWSFLFGYDCLSLAVNLLWSCVCPHPLWAEGHFEQIPPLLALWRRTTYNFISFFLMKAPHEIGGQWLRIKPTKQQWLSKLIHLNSSGEKESLVNYLGTAPIQLQLTNKRADELPIELALNVL